MAQQASGNDKQYPLLRRIGRWFNYKYLLLLRAKGGAAIVAKGFAIGLFAEMFTLPTFGLAFLVIFPLVYLFRASLSGALAGFVFGKIIYGLFFMLNKKVGGMVLPKHFVHNIHFHPIWLSDLLKVEIKLIVGGMIVGAVLGLVFYFPVKLLLEFYASKRKEKRRRRKAQLAGQESRDIG